MQERDEDESYNSAGSKRTEQERRLRPVELLETSFCVANANAAEYQFVGVLADGAVGIPDLDLDAVIGNPGEYFDEVGTFVLADAMANGVFDERLEKKWRHELIEGCGFGVEGKGEALAEALLLYADIEIEKLEFARERDFVLAHLIERDAEELAEAEEDIFGGAGIFLNEGYGGLKCVEEEVGLDLHAQGFEFGGGETNLKLSAIDFALANFLLEMKEGRDAYDDPVSEDAEKPPDESFLDERGPGCTIFKEGGIEVSACSPQNGLDADTRDTCDGVRIQNSRGPVGSREGVAKSERQYKRSEERPGIPIEGCPDEVVRHGENVSARSIADENLGALQSYDNRPESERDRELLDISAYREVGRIPPGTCRV